MAEIDHAIEEEKAQSLTSWLEWVRTPANRYRFFVIVTVGFMIQWCGNALISNYLHLLLDSLDIKAQKTQLIINGCYNINQMFWGNFWSFFIQRMGRRPLFLIGMAGMFVAWLILTVLSGVNSAHGFADDSKSRAAVAMLFVFSVFYKMPAPMVQSYTAEVSPYDLRAKAFVITGFGDALANLFSGYTNPIAIGAIGWKYYIVWCCVLISNFTIVYFFYPETKNMSLEEVAQMFDENTTVSKVLDEEASGKSNNNSTTGDKQGINLEIVANPSPHV
jgi:MFS family permease